MPGLMLKYFVLSPLKNDAYGRASRLAMITYAKEIEKENPELAEDLRKWIGSIIDELLMSYGGKVRWDGFIW